MSKTKKITFYLDNDNEKCVTSGGVIIYKFTDTGMKLLLVNSRGGYEDLGGMIDEEDEDIYDTVSREAYEESNYLLSEKTIKKRLLNAPHIYNKKCKYVVFLIEASKKEKKLKKDDFGDREIHDDINRTVKWISLSTFLSDNVVKHKLNWRLKYFPLFKKLNELNNDNKLEVSLFANV